MGVFCKYSLLCGTNTIRARFPLHLAPLFAISPPTCYINTDNLRIAPPLNAIYPCGEVEVFDIAIRLMDSVAQRAVNELPMKFRPSRDQRTSDRFQKFLDSFPRIRRQNIRFLEETNKKSLKTKGEDKRIIFVHPKIPCNGNSKSKEIGE